MTAVAPKAMEVIQAEIEMNLDSKMLRTSEARFDNYARK